MFGSAIAILVVGAARAPHTRRPDKVSGAEGWMAEFGDTVDRQDIDRFAAHGGGWWDPRGAFWPLHQINPARIAFIRRQLLAYFRRDGESLRPFAGLTLADIGCGGGLVTEPMARLGFAVTGI